MHVCVCVCVPVCVCVCVCVYVFVCDAGELYAYKNGNTRPRKQDKVFRKYGEGSNSLPPGFGVFTLTFI